MYNYDQVNLILKADHHFCFLLIVYSVLEGLRLPHTFPSNSEEKTFICYLLIVFLQHLYGGSGCVRLPAPSLSLLLLIVTLLLLAKPDGIPSPPQWPTWHHHLIAKGQNWLQNVTSTGFGWIALLSTTPWPPRAGLRTFRARTRAFASWYKLAA